MQPRRIRSANPVARKRTQKIINAGHATSLRRVLTEVHELLESYAPTWYSEALSKKIEFVLRARANR